VLGDEPYEDMEAASPAPGVVDAAAYICRVDGEVRLVVA
jgi:hypothetical protein